MKTLFAAAAAFLALAGSAAASDAKGNYAVLGAGAVTCGDLLGGPQEAGQLVALWVHGYATALNQVTPGMADVTGGRTDEQLTDALYAECNGRPDVMIADATHSMIAGMDGTRKAPKKAKKQKPAEPAPAPEEPLPELRRD